MGGFLIYILVALLTDEVNIFLVVYLLTEVLNEKILCTWFCPIIYWECNSFSTSLNAFKKVINPFLSYFKCFSSVCLLGSEHSKVLESKKQRCCSVTNGLWVHFLPIDKAVTLKRLSLAQEPGEPDLFCKHLLQSKWIYFCVIEPWMVI